MIGCRKGVFRCGFSDDMYISVVVVGLDGFLVTRVSSVCVLTFWCELLM